MDIAGVLFSLFIIKLFFSYGFLGVINLHGNG